MFETTCTVLAVYKVVQMDPEDRRRATLSRRRQCERDRRASDIISGGSRGGSLGSDEPPFGSRDSD